MRSEADTNGFTLVELLIGMVLGLIVLGAFISVFIIQNRHYAEQEQIVEMQEYARAGIQMMVSDLLMAGYNPTGISNVGIVSVGTGSIQFTTDINGDGDIDDSNENVTYAFDTVDNQITRKGTAADTANPLVENINSLIFTCYDASGGTTTTPADIRKISIKITATTKNGDRTKTLTSDVVPRNLGL